MPVGAYTSGDPLYPVSGRIGVSITATNTSASGPKHALGDIVTTTRGQKFQYVKAGSTVSQYDVVVFRPLGSATSSFSQSVSPATIAYSSGFRISF